MMSVSELTARPSVGAAHPSFVPNGELGKILKSFNTWRFKREQPSDPALLEDTVADVVRRRAPLHFVLYWGKGPRSAIATPDRACLRFLEQMASAVANSYEPGANLTLIYTDTHARLNGHDRADIERYHRDLTIEAEKSGFNVRRLSDVVAAMPVTIEHDQSDPSKELLTLLEASAAKWYAGNLSTAIAARTYYQQNMVERAAVEAAFQKAIFVTFNNSQHRQLFPENLPIFYMYSLRKGFAVKPWFLDENEAPARLHPPPTKPSASLAIG